VLGNEASPSMSDFNSPESTGGSNIASTQHPGEIDPMQSERTLPRQLAKWERSGAAESSLRRQPSGRAMRARECNGNARSARRVLSAVTGGCGICFAMC